MFRVLGLDRPRLRPLPWAVDRRRPRAVLVDRSWSCTGAVDLDLVKVTLRSRSDNAICLEPGCTGRIDRIEVESGRSTA
jgi:hypothetical protein